MRPEHRSRSEAGRSVGDLGELGVLARIAGRVGPIGDDVVIGIGDDAAAVTVAPGALVLITTDALVEDVHFRRAASAPADVGWKALAINASDIAAMGGEPRVAVISLMLPPALDAAWVDGLYDGLREMAASAATAGPGIAIVGGNLAQAPLVIVDVALIGEVQPDRVIRRTGARPGDLLAVTGTLGRAAAGLLALGSGGGLSGGAGLGRRGDLGSGRGDVGAGTASQQDSLLARAIDAQRRPQPRLAEGRALSATGAVRAMIDLSDGLALDLARLCQASAVGVRLDADRLPVDPCVHAIAGAAAAEGKTALDVALYGGEDYELLFAVGPGDADRVLHHVREATGTPATIIGLFEPASAERTMAVDGSLRPLEPGGWTHFRRKEAT